MKETKEIVAFLKERGFIFPGSDIYGGLANSWDYGPLGTMLKSNIKDSWKNFFIDQQENIFHLDSGIILNSKVWAASGHLGKFNDPMVDCKECKSRFRADQLLENIKNIKATNLSYEEMSLLINKIKCPICKKSNWTNVRSFDLMFKMSTSKTGELEEEVYLRPETAQGVFINFKNIIDSFAPKIPFGIGQIGKAFRNEVTPGNFVFRTKEFEQLELEFFCEAKETKKWFDFYAQKIHFYLEDILKIKKENIRKLNVPKDELAHYSKKTFDFEYKFPFGWGELLGLANRTDFDLKNHNKNSNVKISYTDPLTKENLFPHVIETSMGVERLLFALINDHLKEEVLKDKTTRIVLKLPYILAPYKIAIAPLTNKLDNEAHKLFIDLLKAKLGPIIYIKSGSIGKRYRKQDQIGTPFVITFDFESLKTNEVTIRHRDSMKQSKVLISNIKNYIFENAI